MPGPTTREIPSRRRVLHAIRQSPAPTTASRGKIWVIAAVATAIFVLGAVFLEMVGGSYANSAVPDWAELVPIAWPAPARILWWTAVAGAAGVFRLSLHRLGMRQGPLIVALSVVPFLAFAVGIALGSDWSTWH